MKQTNQNNSQICKGQLDNFSKKELDDINTVLIASVDLVSFYEFTKCMQKKDVDACAEIVIAAKQEAPAIIEKAKKVFEKENNL